MCLSELKGSEFFSRPWKSELGRDVAWTSDDISDSLTTEVVDYYRRTTSDQQQLLVVRQFQVLCDIVTRHRGVLDVQSCLGLDLS